MSCMILQGKYENKICSKLVESSVRFQSFYAGKKEEEFKKIIYTKILFYSLNFIHLFISLFSQTYSHQNNNNNNNNNNNMINDLIYLRYIYHFNYEKGDENGNNLSQSAVP